jgi:hypothetical protein
MLVEESRPYRIKAPSRRSPWRCPPGFGFDAFRAKQPITEDFSLK